MPTTFAILGSGGWGTAIAVLLAQNPDHRVRLWSAHAESARRLRESREDGNIGCAGGTEFRKIRLTQNRIFRCEAVVFEIEDIGGNQAIGGGEPPFVVGRRIVRNDQVEIEH